MKVLLISPLPGFDPPCGDVTYTQSLLSKPPEGVEYETYTEAIARGTLVEHGNRARFGREPFLTIAMKGINVLRKNRCLFWEPFRLFSVKPGEYDLVHVNVFCAGFRQLPCPLVVSNAAPLRYLYLNARGYSNFRVNLLEKIEVLLSRALGINSTSYFLPQVSRVIAFTEYLRQWYISQGIMPADRVDVVPVFQSSVVVEQSQRLPRRIGFMSKDFKARGGYDLLKAFANIRKVRSDVELLIRSDLPESAQTQIPGVTWVPYVPRKVLTEEILPSLDVFAYPTAFDGFYSLIEAMAYGIAVATSDYQAIPEFVGNGRAGLISRVGDVDGLTRNLLRLLEPVENERFKVAAKQQFENNYSADVVLPKLRRSYDAAVGTMK